MQEHPFAPYIRALGKGRNGTRALTEEEAQDAMRMILSQEAQPIQVGALLMLMRVKEETPAEAAGFARAVRATLPQAASGPAVALDWPAYAGKRRQLPWFVLAARLLAAHGIPVLMHGTDGYDPGRMFVPTVLQALGLRSARSFEDAAERLSAYHFAYLPLARISPVLDDLIRMRPILGLRSPVHTVARLLNPMKAGAAVHGVFHPGYRDIHQGAAALLADARTAVFKGEGGEAERNPDGSCQVRLVIDGACSEMEWPALFAQRHLKDETMDPARLAAVWHGRERDEFGEASITGTAAIALHLLGRAATIAEAEALAREMWAARVATLPDAA